MRILICLFLFFGCIGQTGQYELFKDTAVWELAKAVQKEDIEEIKRLVNQEKLNIDFQEEKFGNTLLILSVSNHQYTSFKTLLELGADPNIGTIHILERQQ